MNTTITEKGQTHQDFFSRLRNFLYESGAELRSAGANDQHFAYDGKVYTISIKVLGEDF